MNGIFGESYHLHLEGRKSAEQETSVQQKAIFFPEERDDIFLRNVGSHT
jgi:hypothetical protein